jgi:GAF domain-containing protein/CheY-like chemotaxis protein/HAMP domain-containing protein
MAPRLAAQILNALSGHGPLRRRLARLLATLGIGLLIAVNLAWLPGVVEQSHTSQADLQRIAARGAHDQIHHFLEDAVQHLTAGAMLFRQPYFENEVAELHLLVQRFLLEHPAFTEIAILNDGGRESFRLSRTQAFTTEDLRDRSGETLFTVAIESGTAWGAVVTGATAVPSVSLATRLRRTQKGNVAVVTAVINLQALWDLTEGSNLQNGGRVYVVDQDGRLIAADDPNLVLKRLVFSDRPLIQGLIHAKPSISITTMSGAYTNEYGVPVRATGVVIPGPGWGVVVEQPESVVYAPIRRTFYFTLCLILAGIAVSLWLARLMSRHFTEPITQLRKEVQRFGEGNLAGRVAIDDGSEIGALAAQFNQMAEALESSYQGLEDKVADRTRELSTLFGTARRAVSARDLNEVFSIITRSAAELLACHASSIRLVDRQTNTLAVMADNHLDEGFKQRSPLLLGQGCAGQVALQGQPMVVEDVETDRHYHHKAEALQVGIRAVALAPLRVDEDIIGVLSVYDNKPRRFSDAEVASLTEFAHLASLAIEKARLHEATQRELTERMQAEDRLARLSECLAGLGTDPITNIDRLVAVCGAQLGATYALYNRLDAAQLCTWGRWNAPAELPVSDDPQGHLCYDVIRANRSDACILRDLPRTPYAESDPSVLRYGLQTYIGMAVAVGGTTVGSLCLLYQDDRTLHAQDIKFLGIVAAAIAGEEQRRGANEAVQIRTQQLDAIRTIGTEITRELDLTAVLRLIHARALELAQAESGVLYLWDEVTQVLIPRSWHGFGNWVADVHLRAGEGVAGHVAARQEGHIVNDFRTSDYASPVFLERSPHVAVLAEPLLYRDRLVGVISVNRNDPGKPFAAEDQRLLRLFAAQAAIAIENARLYQAAARRGAELEALLRATRSVMSGLDLEDILDRILAEAAKISGTPYVRLALVDREAGVLRVARVNGGLVPQASEYPMESLSGLVVSSRAPVFSPNVTTDPRSHFGTRYQEIGIVTFLGLPITSGDKVLGVLAFNTTEPREYASEELAYLAAFADQAAVAIEKARLFDDQQRAFTDLQRAQDELVRSQKLRGLGQMAAGIAHDLNNMLAAILGQVELLKLRGAPPEVREGLHTVEMAAADGAEVVRRLQDFARQRGTSPLAPMDLSAAVQEALEITRPRWQDEPQRFGRVITMHTDLNGIPPIMGHPPEIREALTNLIFNAVDAMPDGGTLTFAGSVAPDGVTLTLTDTGVGMSEEVRQKIFEPFFTTKGVKGTGLGLSVVYGIMVRHRGEIEVTSAAGKGTTITLRFRIAAQVPTDARAAASAPVVPRRLLFIDDEAAVRTTLASLLRTAGHSVVEADSGAAGLAALAAQSVDLVLTDLGMPEMTGREVARTVKAQHPRLPVVLLTGWGEHAAGDAVGDAGVDRVLGKPVKLEELLRTIARLSGSPAQDGRPGDKPLG